MRIVPVSCLKDNYAYLVICETTGAAAVVDPSEAAPIQDAVEREQVKLEAIWSTHHHWDHTGGNKALLDAMPTLEVVAHASDRGRVPGQTTFAQDGDEITLGQEVRAYIIHNPGHTSGAISYHVADHAAVFTGDTLFGAGCGRLFEGTSNQMHVSLTQLGALPAHTRVYCGHEYTVANLRFATVVEPQNEAVRARAASASRQRAAGEPTVPSTIEEERATNPFLRITVPAIVTSVQAAEPPRADTPTEIFAALRRWKDRF